MSHENLIDIVNKSVKFHNNKAIQFINQSEEINLSYGDLHLFSESISKYLIFLKDVGTFKHNCFVGVCCNVTFTYPCIICGILKAGLAFVPLDPMNGLEWNQQIIDKLKIKIIIVNRSLALLEEVQLIHSLKILQEKIEFRSFDHDVDDSIDSLSLPLAYSIQTSGTTGSPKVIKVPHQAITPNICELSCLYEITSSDVLFLSSPPTFDPSVVEIFLALSNGASLLIVDEIIKKSSNDLLDVLFPLTDGKITILQTTPSLFMRWSDDAISNRIFGKFSKLRILAFGGEKFPSFKTIKMWKVPTQVNIFNLYGISEVSCWAAVTKLNMNNFSGPHCGKENLNQDDCESPEKALQCFSQAMSHTVLELRDINDCGIGEMFIGSSTRTCLIDHEAQEILNGSIVFRSTGDLFQMDKNKYYFISRKKDEVKRFGVRINLKCIETLAEDDPSVNQAVCVLFQTLSDPVKIGLFITPCLDFSLVDFKKRFRAKCSQGSWPDMIKIMYEIPVTKHGKTDEKALCELMTENKQLKTCLELFESLWLSCTVCDNIIFDKGFISSGGTSFSAAQFMTEFQRYTDVKYEFILNLIQDIDYEECLRKIECLTLLKTDEEKLDVTDEINYSLEKCETEKDARKYKHLKEKDSLLGLKFVIKWHYDLGKCVDASPACDTINGINYVVIGSHSGQVAVLNSDDGTLISKICLPDRIESKACIDPVYRRFTIGCYNGCIYMFTLESKLIWTFKTLDIVKSSAIFVNNCVVCGSYDKFVYCLNSENGQLLWKQGVGGQILTRAHNVDSLIIVATLSGFVKALQFKDGTPVWSFNMNCPVFSNFLIHQNSVGIFAGVQGTIHWISIDKGKQVLEYRSNGNIFSPLVHHNENIIFGTSEGFLYNVDIHNATLNWKIELDSRLVSAPLVLTQSLLNYKSLTHNLDINRMFQFESFVFIVSSKGCVYLLDLKTGLKITNIFLPGEVYSSPCWHSNSVIIGCRDNNVYSISLSIES